MLIFLLSYSGPGTPDATTTSNAATTSTATTTSPSAETTSPASPASTASPNTTVTATPSLNTSLSSSATVNTSYVGTGGRVSPTTTNSLRRRKTRARRKSNLSLVRVLLVCLHLLIYHFPSTNPIYPLLVTQVFDHVSSEEQFFSLCDASYIATFCH